MNANRIFALIVAAGTLAGCSSTETYDYDGPENIRFLTRSEGGWFLMSQRAFVVVHSVDANCRTKYIGDLKLQDKSVRSGIPVGRLSYLAIRFESDGLFNAYVGKNVIRAVIRARAGFRYEVEVTHGDDTYDAVVYEVNTRTKRRKKIDADKDGKCWK